MPTGISYLPGVSMAERVMHKHEAETQDLALMRSAGAEYHPGALEGEARGFTGAHMRDPASKGEDGE